MSIDRASFVPLHAQLKNLFQRQIMAGDWAAGAPMPSESALCRMYGVSRITVRRALSDLEAEGLIRRERGRGTFVAATAPRRGPTLGLLFGGLTQRTFGHRNDTAFGDMVHGAAEAASRRGALVHPMPVGDGDLETMLATPTVFRLTGLLVHLIRMFTEDTLRLLDATGVPYVLIKRRVPPDRANSVYSNDVSGGEAVTHHLLSLGHRRVGLLLGPSEVGVWVDRRAGYDRAHERAGVSVDPDLVKVVRYPMDRGGYLGAAALLDGPEPPTAIFAGNDYIALGVYRAIRERGLEPGRSVAVAGYGANPFSATMFPALTTIGTPAWKLGNAASDLLLDVIGGGARPPVQRVLPWQFEIRQSTVWDPAGWSDLPDQSYDLSRSATAATAATAPAATAATAAAPATAAPATTTPTPPRDVVIQSD